jgi:uncharacterized protein (TIGR02145 family)
MKKCLLFTIAVTMIAFSSFAQTKGTFKDSRDGKTYQTVEIGNQTWMAENLAYKANEGKCFTSKSNNVAKYGYLYDWEVANKACPEGWHLPTKAEYAILLNTYGIGVNSYNALKDGGLSGFNALFGGDDTFSYEGGGTCFWTSSQYKTTSGAHNVMINNTAKTAKFDVNNQERGFSIRCIKNK